MYFKSYQQMTFRFEFFKLVLRIFSLFFFFFSLKLMENAERDQQNWLYKSGYHIKGDIKENNIFSFTNVYFTCL